MPEPFKTFINAAGVSTAAAHLALAYPPFEGAAFYAEVIPRLDALELKARVSCVADALERYLSPDFHEAASHIERALAPIGEQDPGVGLTGWMLWPVGEFVARRGLDHPDRALACLQQLTQRFTAEFAIRPFVERHPALVFATLREWTAHPSDHVRRLVSEGTRPRLPWGARRASLVADPSPALPLLEALLDDDSAYVRRSVANHLNDIAKDHPALVAAWVERHLPEAPSARAALLRHACRTLIKQGDPRVLAAWGRGARLDGRAQVALTPPRLHFGETLQLAVTITSTAVITQALTVDYIVHHVKADGRTSPKVFKGWTVTLPPGGTVHLAKRHAVKPITTRRYHAGQHRVEIQVNGNVVAKAAFALVMPPGSP